MKPIMILVCTTASILLGGTLITTPSTSFAHELDGVQTVAQKPSADQIAKSAALPQTTVVRVNKKTNEVAVTFVKDKLAAGQKVNGLNFETVAINAEKTGIAYTAKDELDATSSTSTWSFGYYNGRYFDGAYARGPYRGAGYVRGPWGGSAGYAYGPRGYAGYVRTAPRYYNPGYANYGYNSGCYDVCGNNRYYYPTYEYSNYSNGYEPYYSYEDDYYSYSYSAWAY